MKKYSPTQINMFLNCSAQWEFRYVDGLKIPPSSSFVMGRSYHKGLEKNFEQKISSKIDMPLDDVLDATNDELNENFSGEILWSKEEAEIGVNKIKNEIKNDTISLVKLYQFKVAPTIQPVSVEKSFSIPFENVDYTLEGRIDLEDQNKIVRENKTSGKTPSDISASYRLQGTIYGMATGNEKVAFDYAVNLKTPKIVSHEMTIEETDKQFVLSLLGKVDSQIKSGLFLPNRSYMMCSRSKCGYWEKCEARHGGKVKL